MDLRKWTFILLLVVLIPGYVKVGFASGQNTTTPPTNTTDANPTLPSSEELPTYPVVHVETDPHEGSLPRTTRGASTTQPTHTNTGRLQFLTTADVFQECGFTRSCIAGSPAPQGAILTPESEPQMDQACVTGYTCDVMLLYGEGRENFKARDDEIILEIYGTGRDWVAVGFSDDLRMGRDFVVECVWEGGESQNVHLYTSRNYLGIPSDSEKRYNIRNPRQITESLVRLISKNRTDDFLWCNFAIKRSMNLLPGTGVSSLERTEFYLLFALGFQTVTVRGHDARENGLEPGHQINNQYAYKNKTNLYHKFGPNGLQGAFIFAHGYIMIFAWMFFLPVSLFISRYYKETYLDVEILGYRLWVFLHASLASIGLFLVILGFGFLTYAKSDWDYVGGSRPTNHLWSGVAAASCYATNTYGAVFLEGRTSHLNIQYSELIHGIVGHLTLFLATICLGTAREIYYSFAPCSITTVVVLWYVTYILFCALMSLHYLWVDWVLGRRVFWTCRTLTTRAIFQRYDGSKVDDAPGTGVRTKVLITFVVVQAAFVLSVSLVYAFDGRRCYSSREYQNFFYS